MKNLSSIRTGILLLALLSGGFSTSASAADVVIFDNLANGNNGFFGVTPLQWDAQRFNSDATNLQLTSATLALTSTGGAGNFFLRLYSDTLGHPGTSLATLFSGPNPGSGNILFGGLGAVAPALLPNTNYWLVLGEPTGSLLGTGWGASLNVTGTGSGFQALFSQSPDAGVTWNNRTDAVLQTRITATVPTVVGIPEPDTWAMMGVGLGLLVAIRGRRAKRVSERA